MALRPEKKLLPLVLSAKASNWSERRHDQEELGREFQKAKDKALQRDGYRCRFCGFYSRTDMEVSHLDSDHGNNDISNLAASCFFCHSLDHIGHSGSLKESVLIWLPEISQAQLNHIVRTCVVARFTCCDQPITASAKPGQKVSPIAEGPSILAAADAVMAALSDRAGEAERLVGTSSAKEMGNILQDMAIQRPDLYDQRGERLYGIRLFNLGVKMANGKNVISDHVKQWISPQDSGAYATGLKADTWKNIMTSVLGISQF